MKVKTIKRNNYNQEGEYCVFQTKQVVILGCSFQDLRRDLQAVIGTRANINIAQIDDYGGETFLCEELAITILQETKLAFQRCQHVNFPLNKKQDFFLIYFC